MVVGGEALGGVAGVVDAVDVELAGRLGVGVGEGDGVAFDVGEPGERPCAHRGAALSDDAGVRGVAVVQDLAGLLPDPEPGGAAAGRAVGDDLGELLEGGAILGAVGAVAAADGDQALAVQAELVVGVVVDRVDADAAIAGIVVVEVGAAAGDDGEAGDRPSDADQAIAALAVVDQRQLGLHARGARRHDDGHRIAGAAARRHAHLAGDRADHLGLRQRRCSRRQGYSGEQRPDRPPCHAKAEHEPSTSRHRTAKSRHSIPITPKPLRLEPHDPRTDRHLSRACRLEAKLDWLRKRRSREKRSRSI